MTALTNERQSSYEAWRSHLFTLASGHKAWKNGLAAIAVGTGKVVPGATATGLFIIGKFSETIDATAGDLLVNVRLAREVEIEWLNNDGASLAVTDIGALCYIKDDQSVTLVPTSASVAGRVWGIEAGRGVAVEMLDAVPDGISTLDGLVAPEGTLSAFSSNNINLPASPVSGTVFELPATAAASTVTLPATADEGTVLYFTGNGTLNGHTVTYRDATGPVSLTTALTASKRHLVVAVFLNTEWRANAYVSP
jgi:hypothetical protein